MAGIVSLSFTFSFDMSGIFEQKKTPPVQKQYDSKLLSPQNAVE
jgi:hypothetical protein